MAAGCSRVMCLEKEQTDVALGIAANMSSGFKKVFGSETKAFHAGSTSGNGIIAALLASEELSCSEGMLDGNDGYLQVFDGKSDFDLSGLFSDIWEFSELAQKYHVSCHFTHSSIESVLKIMKETEVDGPDVEKITVEVSELAYKAAVRYQIDSVLDAKFSIPFCLANTILRKNTGLTMFTEEKIREPFVLDFMEKIFVTPNPSFSPMQASVTLKKFNGEIIAKSADVFNEIPGIEEKKERMLKKFRDTCSMYIESPNIENIIDEVMNLERETNIKEFVGRLNAALLSGRK